MRAENGKLESNIVQFFSEAELDELKRRFDVHDGDVLIMVADPPTALSPPRWGSCVCIWPTVWD